MQASWFGALLLSLAMHLGLMMAAGDGGHPAVKPALSNQSGTMSVNVRMALAPTRPMPDLDSTPAGSKIAIDVAKAEPEPPSLPSNETAQAPAPLPESNLAAATGALPVEEAPLPSLLGLAEAHYFRIDELTEKPQLFPDTEPRQFVAVPDIFPQPVVVHLLINEQGSIDKVVLEESFLSDPAKRFVVDSFSNARFSPGKVGDLTVKSRLSIVVRLEGVLSAH